MNLKQLNTIGSGAYFPIQLEEVKDENGNVEMALQPDGTQVPKVRWGMLYGDVRLIKQNLIAILTFQIGQRFRQEYFGCRIWECIEEPNTQALEYLLRDFIRDGIENWEPRIQKISVEFERSYDKIHITIKFQINNSKRVEDLNFEYNPVNNIINAY